VAGNALSQPQRTWPIENLIALGFGTLTTHEQAAIEGQGVWEDGVWSVVFTRELTAAAADLASFEAGSEVTVAFAIWNGSNEEVGARKQLSSFVTLGLEEPATEPGEPIVDRPADRDNTLAIVVILVGAFVIAVTLAAIVVGRGHAAKTPDGTAHE
jgi:hypothetical protein